MPSKARPQSENGRKLPVELNERQVEPLLKSLTHALARLGPVEPSPGKPVQDRFDLLVFEQLAPDIGPDTIKLVDLLVRLAKQHRPIVHQRERRICGWT